MTPQDRIITAAQLLREAISLFPSIETLHSDHGDEKYTYDAVCWACEGALDQQKAVRAALAALTGEPACPTSS